MKPHAQRWITGVVAVPVLFAVIAYGSEILFTFLIVLAALLGVAEYNRMVFAGPWHGEGLKTFGGALLILAAAATGSPSFLAAAPTVCVMSVLMLHLWPSSGRPAETVTTGKVLLGILYVPLLMSHFILVRQCPGGAHWVFLILVVAFAGDISAYYVGKGLGKRKLLPQISPGKTVEGVLGLFAGSTAGALVFARLFIPELSWVHAAVLGLTGGMIGQLGDLTESALKRSAGVKDSGNLLPGHGGILDRLDCLMFIAPFVYYYRVMLLS